MYSRKRRAEKKEPPKEEKKLEYHLEEYVRTDLKESFDFFKGEGDTISRDNTKSIMANFGWINCASNELERSINEMYPVKDEKEKDNFSFQEVSRLFLPKPTN